MRLRKIDDLEAVGLLMLLQPLVGLALGIYQQWPTLAFLGDNSIVNRQGVVGESLHHPLTNADRCLQSFAQAVAL